jgi:hypothetical protein
MSRRLLHVTVITCAAFCTTSILAQCNNQITPVPLRSLKAANKARDFVRFSYPISATDVLQIHSHEDTETSIGPYDTGFSIKRNRSTLRGVSLRGLPEMRGEDANYANSFTTLVVTRACASSGAIYFITMQYIGDDTSPTLAFVLLPTAARFTYITLPMINGGILEVSRTNPLHLRTWNNLFEGMCNSCNTAYQVTDYEIEDRKLVKISRCRTRKLYSSTQFDDRRRIRFIP